MLVGVGGSTAGTTTVATLTRTQPAILVFLGLVLLLLREWSRASVGDPVDGLDPVSWFDHIGLE